jgi:hypothetical protein
LRVGEWSEHRHGPFSNGVPARHHLRRSFWKMRAASNVRVWVLFDRNGDARERASGGMPTITPSMNVRGLRTCRDVVGVLPKLGRRRRESFQIREDQGTSSDTVKRDAMALKVVVEGEESEPPKYRLFCG